MSNELTPSVLYTVEHKDLTLAIAKELEVVDPDEGEATEKITKNTERNVGETTDGHNRECSENNDQLVDDLRVL
jgi:hypothetical protein